MLLHFKSKIVDAIALATRPSKKKGSSKKAAWLPFSIALLLVMQFTACTIKNLQQNFYSLHCPAEKKPQHAYLLKSL